MERRRRRHSIGSMAFMFGPKMRLARGRCARWPDKSEVHSVLFGAQPRSVCEMHLILTRVRSCDTHIQFSLSQSRSLSSRLLLSGCRGLLGMVAPPRRYYQVKLDHLICIHQRAAAPEIRSFRGVEPKIPKEQIGSASETRREGEPFN